MSQFFLVLSISQSTILFDQFSGQRHVRLRFSDDLNIAKIRRFSMEARKLCPPETFSIVNITTKESCWHIAIGDRMRSKISGRKLKIKLKGRDLPVCQFENLQN